MIDAQHDAPAYVLEFGYALVNLHHDHACDPSLPAGQACTVKMTVRSDDTWTVDAGQYLREFGWDNLPTITLTGRAETPAINLLRWLAETVMYPHRFASAVVDEEHRR